MDNVAKSNQEKFYKQFLYELEEYRRACFFAYKIDDPEHMGYLSGQDTRFKSWFLHTLKKILDMPTVAVEQMAEFSVYSSGGRLLNRPPKNSDYKYLGRSYDLGLEIGPNGDWVPIK